MFPFLKNKNLLSLDIGNYSIKIVEIENRKKSLPIVKHCIETELPLGITVISDQYIHTATRLIKNALKKNAIKNHDTTTAVSGDSVIVRFVKLPYMTEREMTANIKFEAAPYIPVDMDSVEIRYKLINTIEEKNKIMMNIVFVAAKKDLIDSKVSIIENAGLYPNNIDLDAFAIENIVEYNNLGKNNTIIFVDIGATKTGIFLFENQLSKIVRYITMGGNDFTRNISSSLNISFEESEKIKKESTILQEGVNKKNNESNALSSIASNILEDINRSINYYTTQLDSNSISHIYLTGGGANLNGIDNLFSNELEIPVSIFDPFLNLTYTKNEDHIKNKLDSKFVVALGLALGKR